MTPHEAGPRTGLQSDCSPVNVRHHVEQLPPVFARAVEELRREAAAAAALALDVDNRYRKLVTTVEVLVADDSYDNGGDLTVAVSEACGLEDVWRVLNAIGLMADQDAGGNRLRHSSFWTGGSAKLIDELREVAARFTFPEVTW